MDLCNQALQQIEILTQLINNNREENIENKESNAIMYKVKNEVDNLNNLLLSSTDAPLTPHADTPLSGQKADEINEEEH